MSDDLFPDMPETLSPREAWKREHGIWTIAPIATDDEYWLAGVGEMTPGSKWSEGDTEDEALFRLASLLGIQTWEDRK